jgi:hypothetical protein
MIRKLSMLTAVGLIAACTDSGSTPIAEGDADAAAEAGIVIPCGASGVSKGPWSLHVDGSSAIVRWEACRQGASNGVSFAPETGGPPRGVDATESAFVVTKTTAAPLDPKATPDFAGTWYMHEASLTGLSPGTCYTYQLSADSALAGRLCTARAPGDPIRFMAIGDTNPALGHTAGTLKYALAKKPDFVIHGGDIQYYASTLETWALWFPIMNPMLRQGAFFPAIGNHELETPAEYAEYSTRFFGGAGFDGATEHYRFESGGVWFFSVDTQDPITLESPQGQWLTASLADAATKPGFRFSVVFFHKPLVTCGDTSDDPVARAQLEPIFIKNRVTLVLQAHMHGYERFTFPGITYVTTGGGGGIIVEPDKNLARDYCGSRVASGNYHHATVFDLAAAGAASDAGAPSLHGTAIDEFGAVRDDFQITVP